MYITSALAFGLALVGALVATPWARKLALRVGAMDPVVNRSMHKEPKPYLGGLAIYGAFVLAIFASGAYKQDPELIGLALGGGLITLIGIIDDLRRPEGLPGKIKFTGIALTALAIAYFFDLKIDGFIYKGDWIVLPLWLSLAVTTLFITSVTIAVAWSDGLDGLCAGISAIASITLFVVAAMRGQVSTMLGAAALAGSAIGFLRYNFNPAKIFMGDAGSMFLGFALGALSVHGVMKTTVTVGVFVPVLAMGLPIFDTLFAFARRYAQGRPLSSPDKEHLHHRLLGLGFSHREAVLVMWAISAWLGTSAILMSEIGTVQAVLLAGLIFSALTVGALRLGVLNLGHEEDRQRGI